MPKTRNYAVALTIIALSAAGGSLAYVLPDVFIGGQSAAVAFSDTSVDSFSATIAEPDSIPREDMLAQMRKKIAAKKNLFAAVTASEPEEVSEPETETPGEVVEGERTGEQRCASYQTSGITWSSTGVKIEEVEGARLVYKDGAPTMVGSTSVPTRVMLAQLPLKSAPSSAGNCVATDVIGISKNGALMRNGEVLAYSGLGAGVLVGYALDGFPIYSGAHSGAVDKCGGVAVGGQYRYFVGSGQETIINCYSGTPISL